MRSLLTLLLSVLMLSACAENKQGDAGTAEKWDYKEGRVIAKEESRVLVVEDTDIAEIGPESLDEILKAVQPDAIWVTAPAAHLNAVEVGDKVSLELEGSVDDSYPAQGNAKRIVKLAEAG